MGILGTEPYKLSELAEFCMLCLSFCVQVVYLVEWTICSWLSSRVVDMFQPTNPVFVPPSYQTWLIPTKESIGYFNIEAWCVSKLAVARWVWGSNVYIYICMYTSLSMNMEPQKWTSGRIGRILEIIMFRFHFKFLGWKNILCWTLQCFKQPASWNLFTPKKKHNAIGEKTKIVDFVAEFLFGYDVFCKSFGNPSVCTLIIQV